MMMSSLIVNNLNIRIVFLFCSLHTDTGMRWHAHALTPRLCLSRKNKQTNANNNSNSNANQIGLNFEQFQRSTRYKPSHSIWVAATFFFFFGWVFFLLSAKFFRRFWFVGAHFKVYQCVFNNNNSKYRQLGVRVNWRVSKTPHTTTHQQTCAQKAAFLHKYVRATRSEGKKMKQKNPLWNTEKSDCETRANIELENSNDTHTPKKIFTSR